MNQRIMCALLALAGALPAAPFESAATKTERRP
jgi:hypothetical protein